MPQKLCACGCGLPVKPGKDYRHGHWAKSAEGRAKLSALRRVGRPIPHGDGYLLVYDRDRSGKKHVLEHIRIVEDWLGVKLPEGAQIHHINGDRSDNRIDNLAICLTAKAHQEIHRRERAAAECGHPDWRKCQFCGRWDRPENLYIPKNGGSIEHRECGRQFRNDLRHRKKEKQNAADGRAA